ncbi:uncharacterized protein LOC144453002 [Glandiceps talaboti]
MYYSSLTRSVLTSGFVLAVYTLPIIRSLTCYTCRDAMNCASDTANNVSQCESDLPNARCIFALTEKPNGSVNFGRFCHSSTFEVCFNGCKEGREVGEDFEDYSVICAKCCDTDYCNGLSSGPHLTYNPSIITYSLVGCVFAIIMSTRGA